MKEIFEQYAKKGAMTKEDLADVLKVRPEHVRAMAKAGKIPRIGGLRVVRFDPMAVYRALFEQPEVKPSTCSVTIERHKTRAKTNGGYRKCL